MPPRSTARRSSAIKPGVPPTLRFALLLLCACLAALPSAVRAQPTVSIVATDATSAETWPGQTPDTGTVRLTRTGNSASPLTVNLRLRGDAVLGTDYTLTPTFTSVLTFPAGQSDLFVTITPKDDLTTELTKTVRVEIQGPTVNNAYLISGQGRAEVTIADNDSPDIPRQAEVSVATLVAIASEGTNGVPTPGTFRITRSVNTNVSLTVAYALAGDATPGNDFEPLPGSVTIPAGITGVDVVVIPIDDLDLENSESVTLTLMPSACPGVFPPPPDCYTLGPSSAASLTILDNEVPPPPPIVALTATQDSTVFGIPAVAHGAFTASATNGFVASWAVRLDGAVIFSGTNDYPERPVAGTPVSVAFTLTNLTAANHILQATAIDDGGLSTTVTRTLRIIPIPVPFVPASYEVRTVDATAAETEAGEAAQTGRFLVVRTGTPAELEFYFYTFGGSARQGVDYTVSYETPIYTTNGFTNVMSQEIVITPLNDSFVEGTETVQLQLCFPILACIYGVCAPIGTSCLGNATLDLLDNDATQPFAVVSVTASDTDAQEISPLSGSLPNPGSFTIARSAPTTNDLPVSYALSVPTVSTAGVAGPSRVAQNGVDYETLSGVAVIPTGAASIDVVVSPIYDTWVEGNESVTLTLLPPATNAIARYLIDPGATNSATLTIRDYAPTNIPVVSITANDAQAIEENVYSRTGSFLVSRTGISTGSVTIAYDIGGTARNGVDYVALPEQITIPAGTPSVVIVINPIADGEPEPIETVGLRLQPPPAGVFPPPYLFSTAAGLQISAGLTIRDTALYPGHPFLTKRQRILLRRFPQRHVVVPLPVVEFNDPTVPPPAGAVPIHWAVEASSDLTQWIEIGTTSDPEEFVDVNADDAPQRFYRFRQIPPTGS